MKKKSIYAVLCAAVCLVSSCSTSKKLSVKDLTGEWNVVAVGDLKAPSGEADEQPYLGFDTSNGRMFGNAGCNAIMGTFNTTAPEGDISFGNIAATRMMCPHMEFEQAMMTALDHVKSVYEKTSGEVVLCNAEGDELITLRKREASVSAADLAGTWTIEEIDGRQVAAEEKDACKMTFDLNDSTFYCTTPCNTISGTFKSDYIDIKFDNTATTLMECEDQSVETGLSKVLPTITSFGELADGSMGFYSSDNSLVLIIGK